MALEGKTILVPSIRSLEIANAVLVGVRTKRLRQPDLQRFTALLLGEHIGNVLPVAREHSLSVYDGAYLKLSIRYEVPLATLDGKLQKAAGKAGVILFNGEALS